MTKGTVPDELIAYAAAIAPHMGRLAVAVHRQARPAAGELLREFGVLSAGILIDARALLLAEPITLDDLATMERYTPREALAAALEEYVQHGLLERDDDAETPLYACNTRGRDLLLRLTELQGAAITALWSGYTAGLGALETMATRVADHAAGTLRLDQYPAFRAQHAAPAPLGATQAHLLLTRLTTLRYLRTDAHAAAWSAQGLDAAQAGALTRLWRATAPPGPNDMSGNEAALEALRERGLAVQVDDTWRITQAGRTLREAIEHETNRRAAPPWAILDDGERAAFLAGLEALPS